VGVAAPEVGPGLELASLKADLKPVPAPVVEPLALKLARAPAPAPEPAEAEPACPLLVVNATCEEVSAALTTCESTNAVFDACRTVYDLPAWCPRIVAQYDSCKPGEPSTPAGASFAWRRGCTADPRGRLC
jgi:hypothetical protein